MFAQGARNMARQSGVSRAMYNLCRRSLAFISIMTNLQRAKTHAEIKFYSLGDTPSPNEISDQDIINHMSKPYFDNPFEQKLYDMEMEIARCLKSIENLSARLTKIERINGDGRH